MSSWGQANRGEKLGLVREMERKLGKLSMTTFTYRSSSYDAGHAFRTRN
jgi:hypothetical protein